MERDIPMELLFFFFIKGVIRLSRGKVFGTVMQYSLFSVISGCLYNTVHPFRNFLAVLPPPTLYNFETRRKNSGYMRCLWGGARGWAYVN